MTRRYAYKTVDGRKDRLHRHIMREHLGRDLFPNEHVYYLNGDQSDNRINNLVVIKKAQKNSNI